MKWLCFSMSFGILSVWAQPETKSPILPTPVTYVVTGDSIHIKNFSFKTKQLPKSILNILPDWAALFGIQNKFIEIDTSGGLVSFNPLKGAYPESYSIDISKDAIRISYTSEASCLHALNSLFQLTQVKNQEQLSIPIGFISDYPKFAWRGLHLDVSRHFFTVAEVKKYLDLMALYKFNVFHWHLTDDQGWRVEIKKYPKLTEIGGWRDSTVENHYSTFPRTYDHKRYGGFYTQDDIREVVKYAKDRFITIVPEIEMPGHARAALSAYPEYSCTGIQQGVEGLWGVFDDIFCSKNESIAFLQNILDEVCTLFPGEYIHIGGDEAPKTRWKNCQNCQNTIRENKLKDEHELQSYFIRQMDAFLTEKGKKIIGWDEILEGGLSPNAAVMSWRGFDGGVEAAKQGHYVVMSPGSHCYFDHYQSKLASEPLAIGGYTPLSKVYDFSPIAPNMTVQQAAYVLGGQANLWTEYIGDFDQLTYMTYPRAIALSQALWCSNKPNFSSFQRTLNTHHIPRLMSQPLNTKISLSSLKPNPYFSRGNKGVNLQFQFSDSSQSIELNKPGSHEKIRMKSDDKYEIARQKKSKRMKINYSSTGGQDSLELQPHLGLGSQITYSTQPSMQYNAGPLILVDGQRGARPWRGFQWVGFDTNHVEFSIELGDRINIQSIDLNFLYEPSSWIHLPNKVTIIDEKGHSKNFAITTESSSVKFKTKSKTLNFKIEGMSKIPSTFPGEGHTPWIFMDEIIIQ